MTKPTNTLGALFAALALTLAPAAHAAPNDLKIIYIDVEGGASTLYITPQGHSLLIDTGWPAGMGGPPVAPGAPPPPPTPSSAQRIAAAVKAAGLTHIDYMLLSHYHVDHIGGIVELIGLVPIGTFLDHGPNREQPRAGATPAQLANATATRYPLYMAAIAGRPHRVMAAGEVLKIDDLTATVLDADAKIIDHSLAQKPGPGVDCASATTKDGNGGDENPHSVGLLLQWGKARLLALADSTWNIETSLVCPTNLIGTVDLMLADNHGTDISNPPQLLQSVAPLVALFDNGPIKGADDVVLNRFRAVPSVQAIWQLHFATRSPAANTAPDQIANLDGPDAINPLIVTVAKTGALTITNPRNGFSKTYQGGGR